MKFRVGIQYIYNKQFFLVDPGLEPSSSVHSDIIERQYCMSCLVEMKFGIVVILISTPGAKVSHIKLYLFLKFINLFQTELENTTHYLR